MSESKKTKNKNQEVDLIVFFNLIGNVFNRIYNFIASILKFIFSFIIYIVKVFIDQWKVIFGVVIIATLLGYALEKTRPMTYQSDMLVEPYFGSKYQLITNIKYFNALIKEKDYDALRDVFLVDDSTDTDIKKITGFSISPGPETENDKILQYQGFMKRLDSTRKEEMNFDDYIQNRSIHSGDLFLITAFSTKKNIFKKLEKGILSAFTNEYSAEEFKKKEQLRELQKQNLLTQLQEMDSLKNFYIRLRTDESQKGSQTFSLGELSLSTDSKSTTREFELLEKENEIRNQLRSLEEQKIEENKVFDVISSFQGIGEVKSSLLDKYTLIFPAVALLMLCLTYICKRIITYTKNYEY